MKKHPFLSRDEAVRIQNMEPEDQILEMKRLETLADRSRMKQASGGIAGQLHLNRPGYENGLSVSDEEEEYSQLGITPAAINKFFKSPLSIALGKTIATGGTGGALAFGKEWLKQAAADKFGKKVVRPVLKPIIMKKIQTASNQGGGSNAGGANLSSGMTTGQHAAFRMARGGLMDIPLPGRNRDI